MSPGEASATTITCPHCGASFEAELLDGDAGRLRGFKCPHCNLFVAESSAQVEHPPERMLDAPNP